MVATQDLRPGRLPSTFEALEPLLEWCWQKDLAKRPEFDDIVARLQSRLEWGRWSAGW